MTKLIKIGFWTLAGGAAFIACTYNLQPWLVVGQDLVGNIKVVPLLGWVTNAMLGWQSAKAIGLVLFLVGVGILRRKKTLWAWGSLSLLAGLTLLGAGIPLINHFGYVAGFVCWAWVQLVQVAPIFISFMGSKIPEWYSQLKQYRVIAYALEIVAMLLYFPPYAGGDWDRLWADIAYGLNPELIDWLNFGRSIGGLLAVELVVVFLLRMWAALSNYYSTTRKTKGA